MIEKLETGYRYNLVDQQGFVRKLICTAVCLYTGVILTVVR